MPTIELIDQLLSEAEDDRRRIERRENVLRALHDAVTGADRSNMNGARGTAVIVAARVAYGFYLRNGAYVCQPYRAFNRGDLTHLGFYADGAIQPEVPEIVERRQNVEWTFANAAKLREAGEVLDLRLAEVIEQSLRTHDQGLQEGERHDVFLLTRPEERPQTFLLRQRIVHHTWKHSGSPYTRKHRYVYLEALETSPADTDELDAAQHEIDVRRRLGT